jgi:hypothetical protein
MHGQVKVMQLLEDPLGPEASLVDVPVFCLPLQTVNGWNDREWEEMEVRGGNQRGFGL